MKKYYYNWASLKEQTIKENAIDFSCVLSNAFCLPKKSTSIFRRFTVLVFVLLLLPLLLSSCVLQAKRNNTAPNVRIISPQDTEIFIASVLRISIEAEDAEKNIRTIKLYKNGEILGDASRSLPNGQNQDPSLPEKWHFNLTITDNGTYNLSVEAIDQLGLKSIASVSFEVQLPDVNSPNPPANSAAYQSFLENQDKWEDQDIKSYIIDFQRICFCLPEVTQPAQLTVVNQFLNDAIYLSGATVNQNNFFHFYTVDKAFSLIEEAFEANAAEVRVVYDSKFGFPTSAFIDYDERLADEELQFRFSNLTTD